MANKIPGGLLAPSLIASALLIIPLLDDQPYSYYTLLRIVVCGVAALIALTMYRAKQDNPWIWVVGFIALLYNPVIPIHLDPDIRRIAYIASAVILPLTAWKLKSPSEKL
ncbi:MAG: hypothetical protein HYZ88_02715 [Candidatus Omnitrophica bacterium]|nr:hypothetical protein [Candidatus Omnitrophota bacterium]